MTTRDLLTMPAAEALREVDAMLAWIRLLPANIDLKVDPATAGANEVKAVLPRVLPSVPALLALAREALLARAEKEAGR